MTNLRATDVTARQILMELGGLSGYVARAGQARPVPLLWSEDAPTPAGMKDVRHLELLPERAEAIAEDTAAKLRAINGNRDLSAEGAERQRAKVLGEATRAIEADMRQALEAWKRADAETDARVAEHRREFLDKTATREQRAEIRQWLMADPKAAKEVVSRALAGDAPDVASALLDTSPTQRSIMTSKLGLVGDTFGMLEAATPITDGQLLKDANAHRHVHDCYAQRFDELLPKLAHRAAEFERVIGEADQGAA